MPQAIDEDILRHILRQCSASTLSSISQTSSLARAIALPYLLHNVALSRSSQVAISFFIYIWIKGEQAAKGDDGVTNPGKYVRSLTIGFICGNPVLENDFDEDEYEEKGPFDFRDDYESRQEDEGSNSSASSDEAFNLPFTDIEPTSRWGALLVDALHHMPNLRSFSLIHKTEQVVRALEQMSAQVGVGLTDRTCLM